MAKPEIEGTKIIVRGRASYPKVATPEKNDRGQDVYGMTVILSDPTEITKAKKAALAVLKGKFGDKAAEMVRTKKFAIVGGKGCPLREDLKDGYPEGSVYINARSYNRKPGVVTRIKDADGKPTVVPDDRIAETIYPGCTVNVSVSAYWYDKPENKGIAWALENVQFHSAGERLDSRVAAQDEFEADDEGAADLSDLDPSSSQADEGDDLADLLK